MISGLQNFIRNILQKNHGDYSAVFKRYNKILHQLSKKQKIRVCFSVIYDSVFPAESIFDKMLTDDYFDPFILVIPDTCRGQKNMFYQMEKTYRSLSARYKNVYMAYNFGKRDFIDWHNKMDVCFFANPYDSMTHKMYSVNYLSYFVLCLHVPYSYTGHLVYNTNIYKSDEYSKFWRIFVENDNTANLIKNYKQSAINNLCITGYTKMDALAKCKRQNKHTQIIITPHHTVKRVKNSLNISQFLNFADFYLKLPEQYPDINFVFRPHPLLFVNLAQDDLWGHDKVNAYLTKLKSFPNVIYQEGGEYFQTFVDSDAIINDSGSFLVESFYLPMPQCFLLQDEQEIKTEFTDFGQKVLRHVYQAYTEQDIHNFIQNVVLKKRDTMKQQRARFAKKSIITNYPHATDAVISMLKNAIKGANNE